MIRVVEIARVVSNSQLALPVRLIQMSSLQVAMLMQLPLITSALT